MTLVRLRRAPGKIVSVDVRDSRCPRLGCFWPARHTTYASCGASGASARTTDQWECGRREQRGCPTEPVVADPPNYKRRGGAWEEVGDGT